MCEINIIRKKTHSTMWKKEKKILKEKILTETILEKKLDIEDKLQEIKIELSRFKNSTKKIFIRKFTIYF